MDSTVAVVNVGSGSGTGSEESGGSPKNAKEVPIPKSKKTKSAHSVAMKRKRKSRAVMTRERSQVWQHFTKEDHPIIETVDGKETVVGNTKRAQCKYCPTHLACHSTNNGTSSLRKHIEQVCTGYPGRTDLSKGQTHLNFDGSDDVVLKWSQDNCVIAATEMIVIDELPFSAIERPGFRRFCKVAVPNFDIPCRKTIVKTFLGMYDAKKAELKKELNNHCVCLTTDTWTSVQNINYMVITAHFVDNGWRMHKRVLNFCLIPNHQGNTIGKILECSLLQWGIKRVLTISVDNASANKVAIDYIRKKLCNLDQQQVLGGQFLHVRCLAHIVNLIVFDDETVKKKAGEVKDLVTILTDLYASTFGTQSSQKGSRVAEQVTGSSSSYRSKNVSGKMAELLEDWDRELEEGDAIVVGHEVDRYLLDPIEKPPKGIDFEILTWWKLNGSKYPNLQLLAKDVLAIQVSTVASESCFSTGKRVIDPHRSSLTPRSVEALICLQNWLKSDSIQGLEYTPTSEEMVWLEAVEKEQEKEEKEKREKRDAEKAAKAVKAPKAAKAPKLHKKSDAAKAAKK